jgi:hypothetical protein
MAKRISDYNICSPFDGSISGSSSLDTLFTVSLKNYYSVLVPVEIEEATKIELGQKVVLEEFLGVDSIKIDKVDSELKIINGMNFRVFRGMINTDKELLNTLYPCSIVSEKVTIKDLLFTKINSIFEI